MTENGERITISTKWGQLAYLASALNPLEALDSPPHLQVHHQGLVPSSVMCG